MKKDIDFWQFLGFGVASLLGSLLHFGYDLTGNTGVALFSAVNESTWEHMKILFFPMLLFAAIQAFVFGKEYKNFWCVKARGILLGLTLIPVFFYTLNGIFGKTPDFINIAIFFVSAALSYLYEAKEFKKGKKTYKYKKAAVLLLLVLAALFIVFTFDPPKIPLFADPINGSFGL